MHRIDEHVEAMIGSTIFSTLDMTKGYHQMKLHEDSKEATAFASPWGFSNGKCCQWE